MAMRKLPIISALLIEAGRAEDDSVAIVTHATTSRQKVLVTTLKQAEHDVLAHGMEPPSIIVIGEVVNLQPILDWYQPK
jgi:uroporphyrin-III C-methyltransferase